MVLRGMVSTQHVNNNPLSGLYMSVTLAEVVSLMNTVTSTNGSEASMAALTEAVLNAEYYPDNKPTPFVCVRFGLNHSLLGYPEGVYLEETIRGRCILMDKASHLSESARSLPFFDVMAWLDTVSELAR